MEARPGEAMSDLSEWKYGIVWRLRRVWSSRIGDRNGEGSSGYLAGVGGTIGKMCRWNVSDESESRLDRGEDRRGVTDERSRCGFGVFGNSHGPLSSEEAFRSSILLEGIVFKVGLSDRVISSVPSAFLSFHSAAQLDRLIERGVRFGTVVNLSSNGIPPSER